MPCLTRNKIQDSKIEETVQQLTQTEVGRLVTLGEELAGVMEQVGDWLSDTSKNTTSEGRCVLS